LKEIAAGLDAGAVGEPDGEYAKEVEQDSQPVG
jgi:hypothetical protein